MILELFLDLVDNIFVVILNLCVGYFALSGVFRSRIHSFILRSSFIVFSVEDSVPLAFRSTLKGFRCGWSIFNQYVGPVLWPVHCQIFWSRAFCHSYHVCSCGAPFSVPVLNVGVVAISTLDIMRGIRSNRGD